MKTILEKSSLFTPAFRLREKSTLLINAGTIVAGHPLPDTVVMPDLALGRDYQIVANDDTVEAQLLDAPPTLSAIGGFHVGLDGEIAAHSIWDNNFRPKAQDPRGMVFAGSFWVDIYLLNIEPRVNGTSSPNKCIADGASCSLNWWKAVEILAEHGKQLLSMAEFSIMAAGVKEGKNCAIEPDHTGFVPQLKSGIGVEQATGCMWTWGSDFDPCGRAIVMGGGWFSGAPGPRQFFNFDPDFGWNSIGARGRCDHLILG
jgi:hypothetical protein